MSWLDKPNTQIRDESGALFPPQPTTQVTGPGAPAVSTDPANKQTILTFPDATVVTKRVDSGSAPIAQGYVAMQKNGKLTLATTAALALGLYHAGIVLAAGAAGGTTSIITQGLIDPTTFNLGAGAACAVGTDANGKPVRVTDVTCTSGLKYVGSCDANGAIYVSPFNDSRYTITNYGAIADSDGAGAGTDIGPTLQLLIEIVSSTQGGEIYIPGGKYRLATTVNVDRNVQIRGAGGGLFYAPTQIFVDPSVTGFAVPYNGSRASGSRFQDFWIGAVSNNATTTTGDWTQATRQIVVSSIADFVVGQVVCLHGIGGQTPLPYVLGTVTNGSNQVTLSEVNGVPLKVGHFITLGAAFPTATQITAINKSAPTAWVLTMASNAAAGVTGGQVKYCFDALTRITAIAGTTVTVDTTAEHVGSGSIPTTMSAVLMSHADCAFYVNTTIRAQGVDIGGGSTSGALGFAGAGWCLCGSTSDVPASNTDMVFLSDGYAQYCKHAVYTRGDACNVIRIIGITAVQCFDWSFCETAFLGNTFVACHSDGGFGFITTAAAANASVFLGCYIEVGTVSALGAGALWLGGVQSYDPGGTAIVGGRTNRAYFQSNDNSTFVEVNIADFGTSTFDLAKFWPSQDNVFGWAVRETSVTQDGFSGWWGVISGKGTRSYAMLFPESGNAAWVTGAPPVWFPGGIFIGGVNATSAQKVGIFSGSGTPEGAVTAPVGSLYTDRSGGAGSTLYVKESGAGNTGWVAK